MEASIAKVAGSETLNFVLDENIQIHGGNGYVRDYPAERHFRDARVNRIFEGTNEINRLLIPGMLARRAVKGDLGIIPAARALQDELLGPLRRWRRPTAAAGGRRADRSTRSRRRRSWSSVSPCKPMGRRMADEQEVLMHLADMLIDVYSAESAVLRARAASLDARRRARHSTRTRRASS